MKRYPARLVLASGSPTRLRLLRDAGLDPEVVVSGVDEAIHDVGTAAAVVAVAERKAFAVSERRPGALVIGCDSMLDLDGMPIGKPASAAEALAIWRRLSGRRAMLHTGHCLIDGGSGQKISAEAHTLVRFGTPTEDEIAAYVSTGEPLSMAGAFSIEGRGAPFVESIDGDASNVLGLSLPLLRGMLADVGKLITDLWWRPYEPLVRSLTATHRPWLAELLITEWGLPVVTVSGVYDASTLAALVAEEEGQPVGALTYRQGEDGLEVVTLNSVTKNRGVGSALLAEARRQASAARHRLWLVTTNENLRAIAFYQRRGMDMVALHRNFAGEVQRHKPGLGTTSEQGIIFRHALEFEYAVAHEAERPAR